MNSCVIQTVEVLSLQEELKEYDNQVILFSVMGNDTLIVFDRPALGYAAVFLTDVVYYYAVILFEHYSVSSQMFSPLSLLLQDTCRIYQLCAFSFLIDTWYTPGYKKVELIGF